MGVHFNRSGNWRGPCEWILIWSHRLVKARAVHKRTVSKIKILDMKSLEAGHPLNLEQDQRRQMYIDQRNISHIITSTWWEGKNLMGTVETARTRAGEDMRGLILQGSDVAFSMRGVSNNVKRKDGYIHVGSPLMISAFDWVVLPSHLEAYIQKDNINTLTSESVEMSNPPMALSEGIMTPFNASEILKHIVDTSFNVEMLAEELDLDVDINNMSVDRNGTLSITNQNATIKMFLEESLKYDINDFFLSL